MSPSPGAKFGFHLHLLTEPGAHPKMVVGRTIAISLSRRVKIVERPPGSFGPAPWQILQFDRCITLRE